MIVMGKLTETTDTSTAFSLLSLEAARRSTAKLRHGTRRIAVIREVLPLTVDQVWARFYVRGGMDLAYAEPDAFDDYLRVLAAIPGARGTAARAAFLHGWAEHRAASGAAA